MTNEHPITPPPELVQQWGHDANLAGAPWNDENWAYELFIAACAAQWGADQELEACARRQALLYSNRAADELRAARRPKPQSLKEQALEQLDRILKNPLPPFRSNTDTIRRALEALPDD